jgi:hypothetical protein
MDYLWGFHFDAFRRKVRPFRCISAIPPKCVEMTQEKYVKTGKMRRNASKLREMRRQVSIQDRLDEANRMVPLSPYFATVLPSPVFSKCVATRRNGAKYIRIYNNRYIRTRLGKASRIIPRLYIFRQ